MNVGYLGSAPRTGSAADTRVRLIKLIMSSSPLKRMLKVNKGSERTEFALGVTSSQGKCHSYLS